MELRYYERLSILFLYFSTTTLVRHINHNKQGANVLNKCFSLFSVIICYIGYLRTSSESPCFGNHFF